jgi:Fe2+ transport system protein FeoA
LEARRGQFFEEADGMTRTIAVCLAVGLCGGLAVKAQPAAPSIEAYFTGKMATVKIDMPGTEKGVDLNFAKATPLDKKDYSSRLTTFGIAIHKGDSVRVTKVALKKDHIEFQLNGGGYGTFGETSATKVSTRNVEKSSYEKDLEKQLKATKDATQRTQIQQNLDAEVARREQAEADAKASAQAATQEKEVELASKRARSGSRFNLNFKGSVPNDDKNPDAVMKLLADYVDFAPSGQGIVDAAVTPGR